MPLVAMLLNYFRQSISLNLYEIFGKFNFLYEVICLWKVRSCIKHQGSADLRFFIILLCVVFEYWPCINVFKNSMWHNNSKLRTYIHVCSLNEYFENGLVMKQSNTITIYSIHDIMSYKETQVKKKKLYQNMQVAKFARVVPL